MYQINTFGISGTTYSYIHSPMHTHTMYTICVFINQFSSVAQSCPTLPYPMNHSTWGLRVHQKLLEFTQPHVHLVSDAIQPSHPLSSPSPPAPNPSRHQGLFQWVNSLHEVAKVLEFQLQQMKGYCWTKRFWDSWPLEETNSIWGQRQGWIAQSFCVIKFY